MQVPAAPTVPPAWQGYRSQFVPPLLEFRAYIQAYAEAVFRNDPFQRKFKSLSIQKQNRKHCEVRLPTSIEEAALAPSYHLAAPSRQWRPCARTRANSGVPTAEQHGLVFIGATLLELCAS
jgi:hypothetical protein